MRSLPIISIAALPILLAACGDLGTNPNFSGGTASSPQSGYGNATADDGAPDAAELMTAASMLPRLPHLPSLRMASGSGNGMASANVNAFHADFENQDPACWGNRQASGYSGAACGDWSAIGSRGARLADGESSRSGRKSMAVTFTKNEEVAGASLPLNADTVNVRAFYNFAQGFDFGQGIKIGRVSSFNEATQKNDIDMVLEVRSAGAQCGLSDMADVGLYFNGRPVGHDWGNIATTIAFQRGRWYAVEYQVALNTPGNADGSVRLWVDGVLAASKTGIDIRGAGSSVKLNRLRLGGWYSNGAHGNACADPNQPSTLYIDDVAVGSGIIGMN